MFDDILPAIPVILISLVILTGNYHIILKGMAAACLILYSFMIFPDIVGVSIDEQG